MIGWGVYVKFLASACAVFSAIVLSGQQPKLVLPIGHTAPIISAAFSPDGKKVVTSSEDNTAKIWDVASSKLISNLQHTGRVVFAEFSSNGKNILTFQFDNVINVWDAVTFQLLLAITRPSMYFKSASFSPDGNKIVTACEDGTAKIWDTKTGNLIVEFKGHTEEVTLAKFSADGKKLLTASRDRTVKIWNVASGRLLINLERHTKLINDACFSSDGSKVLTASNDHSAKLWNALSGQLIFTLERSTPVSSARFSPDAKKIVTSDRDGLTLWETASATIIYEMKGHTADIIDVAFSPDGKKILSASWDSTARIWNSVSGKLTAILKSHAAGLTSARFSPNGKNIVTSSLDFTAKIWNASPTVIGDLKGYSSRINFVQISPDGQKIVSALNDKTAKVWNAVSGSLIHTLKGHTGWVLSAQFSPFSNDNVEEQTILTTGNDYNAKLWDAKTGRLLLNFTHAGDWVMSAAFSPLVSNNSLDIKRIATSAGSRYANASVWDAGTGKLITQLKGFRSGFSYTRSDDDTNNMAGHSSRINYVRFSPDGKKILTASNDNTVKVWDALSGNRLVDLKGHSKQISSAQFSPDGEKIITASWDETTKIWHAVSGKLLQELEGHTSFLKAAQFSPDGKKIITASLDKTAKIWDTESGKLLITLKGHTSSVETIGFSPDGKKIVTASADNTGKVWDAESGKYLFDLIGHSNALKSAAFTPNGKRIISFSDDNTIRVWEAADGKEVYTFFALSGSDYFNQVPAGYYQCTPAAVKLLHYITKDFKILSFEQLDVKYNRPDKVLEAIGNTDTALIKSYRKAFEKRIKILGIDTTAFRAGYSIPEADFANRDAIEYEQQKGVLKLIIKGKDITYKLDRFNVWVNEVPVFGQRGISIRKRKRNDFDTTINLTLSQGENRLETSITDVNGTESYRMPLTVNYAPAVKQKESLRFIGIGIDQFNDSQYNLEYSSKDIRDLAKKLKEKYKDDIIIDTLFNENVTIEKVKALKKALLNTNENDMVIIAYSGHGMLSKDYDYYLSTYSVNFQNPEENGLPYDELENLLDSIPARKKLMLIDACHSGEVDKEEGIAMNKIADSLGLSKGIIIEDNTTQTQQLGLKNSFELMQSLFVNVGKSTGATIISAAAGNQFALERGDLKNGVFTYSILEAMEKNPTMKISELKKIVGERVEQLTNGMQKPTSRSKTIAVDWSIW
ncbi:MAG: caspase family protein [Chitinophagaceae bacterium]